MGAHERAPRHRPLTARLNALFLEDLCDRRSGDSMAEILERALDPPVAPGRIVGSRSGPRDGEFRPARRVDQAATARTSTSVRSARGAT